MARGVCNGIPCINRTGLGDVQTGIFRTLGEGDSAALAFADITKRLGPLLDGIITEAFEVGESDRRGEPLAGIRRAELGTAKLGHGDGLLQRTGLAN